MKIKCPVCGWKIQQDETLFNHIYGHDEGETARYITDLVEKIHKKIELVEKLQEQRKQEFNEIDFTNDQIIKELKSLLEDKK